MMVAVSQNELGSCAVVRSILGDNRIPEVSSKRGAKIPSKVLVLDVGLNGGWIKT